MTSHNISLARFGLAANGVFSLASGMLLATSPSTVGAWLGVDIDGWLRLFGIVLLGHGAAIAAVIRQPRIDHWVKLNLALIAGYPLAMVAVVLAGLVEQGRALVLADGAVVGAFAVMQWLGVRRVGQVPHAPVAQHA